MKQVLLLTLISFFSFQLLAQPCVPDELYRDSAVGVYPAPDPMGMDLPDQGITESACIDAGYEFVLTFKIPPTINFNGTDIPLDSIVIEEEGAVMGLPAGMDYGCNPENCVFSTEVDSLACLVINGTANDTNTPGVYALSIQTKIWSNGFSFDMPFPNSTIPGADGEYNLVLEEAGNMDCFITSNIEPYTPHDRMPVSDDTFSCQPFRKYPILSAGAHF